MKKKLRMIKVNDFNLIQPDMLEKGCDGVYLPKMLYKHSNEIFADGLNILYALVDSKKVIQGYIWGVVNTLRGILNINAFYIKEDYKEDALKIMKKDLLEAKDKLKLTKVLWITSDYKMLEKAGFKKSEEIIMELENKELKDKEE